MGLLEARSRGVPLHGLHGTKEDGTLGPGELVKERKKEELVKERKKEKLAMGKKSKMAYNMVRWVIESMANARTGRRWLG